jgi:uncharacterized protein YegJ (DUF2314 family)
MRRPSIFALGAAFCLLGIVAGCSGQPETLVTDYSEAEMAAAIAQARATFGEFKARLASPQPGDSDFEVKARIEDAQGVEHFWLTDVIVDQEPYFGVIGNDPGIVSNVKLGQTYRFYEKDVADWTYRSDGVVQGNHTARVLLRSLPEDEAEALREDFGW